MSLEPVKSSNPARERRCKRYQLGWLDVLRLAGGTTHDTQFVRYPKIELPEDAVVLGVYRNHATGTFDFHVASMEFEPVDECFELPVVRAEYTVNEALESDLLELAWGIIANAHGGDWSQASTEWIKAAEKWRDEYYAAKPATSPGRVRGELPR